MLQEYQGQKHRDAVAKGQYLAFLDSDDIWFPKKLEHQIKFMKENRLRFPLLNIDNFASEIFNCKSLIDVKDVVDYKTLLKAILWDV